MAKQINYRFNFHSSGVNNLLHARNVIKSFGGTSWIASNAMSRSFSSAEKSAKSLMGTLVRMSGAAGMGLGLGLLAKGLVMNSSELQTNMIVFKTMMKGKEQESKKMIAALRDNAAEYGFDEGEVFKSARGLYSAYASAGRKVDTSDIMQLMEMVETVSMMDTENRGLSFTAFAFKEIAQGQGKLDFRSLTNRLEIPFTQATQAGITAALKSGDVKKATQMMWKGLNESNIGKDLLKEIALKGFIQNLNAIKGYTVRMFQTMGMPIVETFAQTFNKVKEAMKPMMMVGSDFMNMLEGMGNRAAKRIQIALADAMVSAANFIEKTDFTAWFTKMTNFAGALRGVFGAGFDNIKGFLEGFAGTNSKTDFIVTLTKVLKDIKPVIESLKPAFVALGAAMGNAFKFLADNPDVVKALLAGAVVNKVGGAVAGGGGGGWFSGWGGAAAAGGAGLAGGGAGAAAINAARSGGGKGWHGLNFNWTNGIRTFLVNLQKDVGSGILPKMRDFFSKLRVDFTHLGIEGRKIWTIIKGGIIGKTFVGIHEFFFKIVTFMNSFGPGGLFGSWAAFKSIELLGEAGKEFYRQNEERSKTNQQYYEFTGGGHGQFAGYARSEYETVKKEKSGATLSFSEKFTLQLLKLGNGYNALNQLLVQNLNKDLAKRPDLYGKSAFMGSTKEKIRALEIPKPKVDVHTKVNANSPITINQYINTNDPKVLADKARDFLQKYPGLPGGVSGPARVGQQFGGAANG